MNNESQKAFDPQNYQMCALDEIALYFSWFKPPSIEAAIYFSFAYGLTTVF